MCSYLCEWIDMPTVSLVIILLQVTEWQNGEFTHLSFCVLPLTLSKTPDSSNAGKQLWWETMSGEWLSCNSKETEQLETMHWKKTRAEQCSWGRKSVWMIPIQAHKESLITNHSLSKVYKTGLLFSLDYQNFLNLWNSFCWNLQTEGNMPLWNNRL